MKNVEVGIIMGSDSDLDIMSQAALQLEEFDIPHEIRVLSVHRTPDAALRYASEALDKGIKIIIAGAGGSAHLPGMAASHTTLPVIAVPIKRDNHDHEALWSNIKMPPGIPLATMPENGAKNAALMAIEILSLIDPSVAKQYNQFRKTQHDTVEEIDRKIQEIGWKAHLKNRNS